MKVVSTKLNNPLWEKLIDKCNANGVTIAEHLRLLIEEDLGEASRQGQNVPVSLAEGSMKTHRSSLIQLLGKKK